MADELDKEQLQFVALLLKNRELVEDYNESPINLEFFENGLRMIIHAISNANDKGVVLTRKSFLEFAQQLVAKNQEMARLEVLFSKVQFTPADKNDYPLLKEKILNAHIMKQVAIYTRDFARLQKEKNAIFAIQQLSGNMADLAGSCRDKKGKIVYEDLGNYGKDYYQNLCDIRDGKVEPKEFISYGIEELDKTSGVGLAPGTMTLFCGDVGGFKSTMMLNVGLHAWWKGNQNVLFVPLEMPKDLVYQKMLSRQTQIQFDYINDPLKLTKDQLEKIRKFSLEEWPSHGSRIFLLDSYEERMKVSLIRRMIERNLEIFKPRIVIVDYIANLTPDKKGDRPDIEVGEMLKDLRYMGRPGVVHSEGFAIVSGAQIGREGLKRNRRTGNDKAMFYSEDLRGSHDYSADADTIYAQFPDPQQDDRLQVFVVKARYGKKKFPDDSLKASLEVKPEISMIRSTADYYAGADKSEVLKKAATEESDLDFTTPAKSESVSSNSEKSEPSVNMDDQLDEAFGEVDSSKEAASDNSNDWLIV